MWMSPPCVKPSVPSSVSPLSPSRRNFFRELSVNFSKAFFTFSLLSLWKSMWDNFFRVFFVRSMAPTPWALVAVVDFLAEEEEEEAKEEDSSWLCTNRRSGGRTSWKFCTVSTVSRQGRSCAREAGSRQEGQMPAVVGFILWVGRTQTQRDRQADKQELVLKWTFSTIRCRICWRW